MSRWNKGRNCLRFQAQGEVTSEAVSPTGRPKCACGDGVWWRIKPGEDWKCRTCKPANAILKAFWLVSSDGPIQRALRANCAPVR